MANDLTYSRSYALLGKEFDDFLYAPIAREKNGMELRVVSALARLDLDPWEETAKLSGLPRLVATTRLTEFFLALPDELMEHLDFGAIAASLIYRLPRHTDQQSQPAAHPIAPGSVTMIHFPPSFYLALVFLLILANVAVMESWSSQAPASNAAGSTQSKSVVRSPGQP